MPNSRNSLTTEWELSTVRINELNNYALNIFNNIFSYISAYQNNTYLL